MSGTMLKSTGCAGAIALLCITGTATAQDAEAPEVYKKVVECRSIADDTARLACFDASVQAMDEATENEDLVVMSRTDIKQAKRGLFGLSLPRIKLFGGDDDEEEIKLIEAKITSFSRSRKGWVVTLDDGAVWEQSDNVYVSRPKVGEAIVIKKAALGSFMARIDDGVAFRIKRRN